MNRHALFIALVSVFTVAMWGCSKQDEAGEAHEGHEHAEQVATGDTAQMAMGGVMADTTQVYTCPRHPNVVRNKPGQCDCGTLLVLKDAPAGTKYVCPMHTDVSQDGPGRCPHCNMFLVAKPPAQASQPAAKSSM